MCWERRAAEHARPCVSRHRTRVLSVPTDGSVCLLQAEDVRAISNVSGDEQRGLWAARAMVQEVEEVAARFHAVQ